MTRVVRVSGGADGIFAALRGHLDHAAFRIENEAARGEAQVLVCLPQAAEDAIADATRFADAGPSQAAERLVVQIWTAPTPQDWAASRHAATLAAFTVYAAREWAGRRVRVNALRIGDGVDAQDMAAAISALWRWRSMTGQIIGLAA